MHRISVLQRSPSGAFASIGRERPSGADGGWYRTGPSRQFDDRTAVNGP